MGAGLGEAEGVELENGDGVLGSGEGAAGGGPEGGREGGPGAFSGSFGVDGSPGEGGIAGVADLVSGEGDSPGAGGMAGNSGVLGGSWPGAEGLLAGSFVLGIADLAGRRERRFEGSFLGSDFVGAVFSLSRVKYFGSSDSRSLTCTMTISFPGMVLCSLKTWVRESGSSLNSSSSSMTHHLSASLLSFSHLRICGSFIWAWELWN